MTAAPEPRAAHSRGFGLLEVLVALAISAIGLLGEALLLRYCLATEAAALRREQAATLLAELAERIRTNATAAASYALPAGTPPPAMPACAVGARCTPAELATADLAQWLAEGAALLPAAPGAPGTVDYIRGAPDADRLDLSVYWGEPASTAPAALSLSLLVAGTAP